MISDSYFLCTSIYSIISINPLSTRGLITKIKFQYKNAQLVKNSLLWNKVNDAPILSCTKSRKISILTQSFIESICIYPMQSFRVYRYFVDQFITIGARRQQAIQGYHSFKSHALHDKNKIRPAMGGWRAISRMCPSPPLPLSLRSPQWRLRWHSTRLLPVNRIT